MLKIANAYLIYLNFFTQEDWPVNHMKTGLLVGFLVLAFGLAGNVMRVSSLAVVLTYSFFLIQAETSNF